ncbi:MAG: 2-C-methyl-D-erythritol 2,4-cyclodiphosphate synthase, partial [Rectinema sp.]|nr:2-C-methyl-D-erythritol 2,4-cyclodiphosphate synthase [Rectinema sp.]
QSFSFLEILEAHRLAARDSFQATDDAMIWSHYVGPVSWIEGDRMNRKITYREDLAGHTPLRVGQGWDIHALVEGRRLLLAGVVIDSPRGEYGHSDGDVLWHAVIDALLGAASLGDIGTHFPPSDPQWKNADSGSLAARIMQLLSANGWKPVNLDCTVVLESPRLAPYRERIIDSLSRSLGLPKDAVSFKAKTNEGFDATGRGEAIEAYATVLISRDSQAFSIVS